MTTPDPNVPTPIPNSGSNMQPLDGRYRLGRCIGRGGVGEVHLGWQVALDRPVAIKLLRPELTRTPLAVARFEREARTTSLLNHPNVVTVIDIGRTPDDRHFVVMELLEGHTLGEVLTHEGRFPVERVLSIAQQVARGMGAGQGVGLVHRDLKPDNIFLIGDAHIKVLDFGLATLREPSPGSGGFADIPVDADTPEAPLENPAHHTLDLQLEESALPGDSSGHPVPPARLTRPGALMGTPRYMAPEQVLGWAVDQRTDLYSFGVILYELLVGHPPFRGPGQRAFLRQHLHEDPPSITEACPEVPRAVESLVRTLLAKSPADRYQDWSSLSDALRKLSRETVPAAPAPQSGTTDVHLPVEPYRFLTPFTAATRGIFFGRDTDLQRFRETWEHPDRPPIILLTGASGVGKTSFLSARIVPALKDTGHRVLRIRGTAQPLEQLARLAVRELRDLEGAHTPTAQAPEHLPAILDTLFEAERRPLAIVIDQLEEVFTQGQAGAGRAFQATLASILAGSDHRARFILSMREDYLGATLRTLHPLPVEQLCRNLPLRPLDPTDIAQALSGPGQEGLPVHYAPFRYEPGLVDVIVGDLISDTAGEVAPRIQAVGARLWGMARARPEPHLITFADYRQRLGGARGILARVLDEAIAGLDTDDQGVAKEMLRALTHLPGSPTSRPVQESALLAFTADPKRRRAVLGQLEDRWRVIHGYHDPRRSGERVLRIAHESLIARIQQYGEEGTDRNRARQLFLHGFDLWLKGGERDEDLLAEHHYDEIQHHIDNLVLRTNDEVRFYKASSQRHDEYYLRKHREQRFKDGLTKLQFFGLPTVVLAVGVFIGQALTSFTAVDRMRAMMVSYSTTPGADLSATSLRSLNLPNGWLRGVNLDGADLRDVDLSGADLQRGSLVAVRLAGANLSGANLAGATIVGDRLWDSSFESSDLRGATVWVDPTGSNFHGARYDWNTRWREGIPADCAFGPRARWAGCDLRGQQVQGVDLEHTVAPGGVLDGADFTGSRLSYADFSNASLRDAVLVQLQLVEANLKGADLTNADLSGSRLHTADLRGADLTNADLRTADISGADLTGATICNTRLGDASGRWVERWNTKSCPAPTPSK